MRQLSFQWNKYHDFTTHRFFKILLQKVPKIFFFNDTGQFFTGTIDMLLVVFGIGNLLKIEPVLTKKFLQQDLSPAKLSTEKIVS